MKLRIWPWVLALVCVVLAASNGCSSPQAKALEDAVIKEALAECIAENPMLGDVELQTVCKFADDLWPLVRNLMTAQKRGMAKVGAMRDAGCK